MGYFFQSAALFVSFTVNENLAMPLHRLDRSKSPEEINRAVEETLQEVGLEKDGKKMPSALSGGMQKRAGSARALILQPQILLVDEPSSGLDRITAGEIDDLLMKVKTQHNTTIVMVTHDIHSARRIADKFAVLDEGRLMAFGTPEELDKKQDNRLLALPSERVAHKRTGFGDSAVEPISLASDFNRWRMGRLHRPPRLMSHYSTLVQCFSRVVCEISRY